MVKKFDLRNTKFWNSEQLFVYVILSLLFSKEKPGFWVNTQMKED